MRFPFFCFFLFRFRFQAKNLLWLDCHSRFFYKLTAAPSRGAAVPFVVPMGRFFPEEAGAGKRPPLPKGKRRPKGEATPLFYRNFIRLRPMAGLNSRSTCPAIGRITISTVALTTDR